MNDDEDLPDIYQRTENGELFMNPRFRFVGRGLNKDKKVSFPVRIIEEGEGEENESYRYL
jgi:hypothetical protein